MTTVFYIIMFFIVAAMSDIIIVLWHRAREEGDVWMVVALGSLAQTVGWLPLVWAVEGLLSVWAVAAVDILGSALGGGFAVWRIRRGRE